MALAVGDVWAFALEQRLYGQIVFNTWAQKIVALGSANTEQSFMDYWWGTTGIGHQDPEGLLANLSEIQSMEVSYIAWHVHRVLPVATNIFVIPVAGILAGLKPLTAETANLSLSIARKGLEAGKRNRGRIAVAGLPSDSMNQGEFTANALAEAAGVAAEMRGQKISAVGGTVSMGFFVPYQEYVEDGETVIRPAKFTDCVHAAPKKSIRVQRSRTVGVGR